MSDTLPSPLTPTMLEHLRWLAEHPNAVAIVDKPVLARLLDDRRELINAMREWLRDTGSPYLAEQAERLLLRMEG